MTSRQSLWSSLDIPPAPAPAWGSPQPVTPTPGPSDARPTRTRLVDASGRAAGLDRGLAVVANLVPVFVLGFVTPLVVWLGARTRGTFVETQAREALNFQLTLLAAYVVSWVLVFWSTGFLALVALVWLAQVVLGIVASATIARGEAYRYPVNLRVVR